MSEQSKNQKTVSQPGNEGRKRSEPQEGDSQSGSTLAAHAKNLVDSQITKRTREPANDLRSLAKALHLVSEQLEDNVAAPYVEKAAGQMQRMSQFIEDANASELFRGAENLAREKPLMFMGAAFAIGFSGARFMKSSARHGTSGKGSAPTNPERALRSQKMTTWERHGSREPEEL